MDRLTELERKLENMLRMGTVSAVQGNRCRVQSGEINTNWLLWFANRAGDDKDWWPLSEGEQVMILSPGGDLANGYVLAGAWSDANGTPSTSPSQRVTTYGNGSSVTWDKQENKLTVVLNGDADISADGDIKATATGKIQATAQGDIEATTQAALKASCQTLEATAVTTVAITAPGGTTITGPLNVLGPLTLAGPITAAPSVGGTAHAAFTMNVAITGSLNVNGVEVGDTHKHVLDTAHNTTLEVTP